MIEYGGTDMLDVQQAVSHAMQAFSNMVGPKRAAEALLEEVEMVRDNGSACWAVTVSEPSHTPALAALSANLSRDYKVLRIDAETGAFISMRVRKI